MKCPKCSYLGFETGDRCKNCGYDFSLLAFAPAADPDLSIRTGDEESAMPELSLAELDRSLEETPKVPAPDPPLPLFNPNAPDDVPLIAVPAAPRPPLAVRRTPETPRLRAVAKVTRMPVAAAPALDFRAGSDGSDADDEAAAPAEVRRPAAPIKGAREVGGRRILAALIDHGILLAIDAAVVYFTMRMAGLAASELVKIPPVPMLTFLALLKLSYFTSFTAIGGQTIGKMAAGIRVVGEPGPVDSARAVRRTLAGLLSVLTLGLGFLPAFFGADRRTLHDRLTCTRVVGLNQK